ALEDSFAQQQELVAYIEKKKKKRRTLIIRQQKAAYRSKMLMMNENKNNEVLKDADSNDINLKEEDVITKMIGGIPSVRFFDRVHGILSQSIKRTVIMKLLGW
ncbi:hypothetical protein Godav_023013, partial [Gossypium davidsonii]|nr:hypothetical protein [Gossypium davidsonii]